MGALVSRLNSQKIHASWYLFGTSMVLIGVIIVSANAPTRRCVFLLCLCCAFSTDRCLFHVMQLLRSSHRVMMITGDHPLTAVSVASKLRLLGGDRKTLPEDVLILRSRDSGGLAWVRAANDADDSSEAIPYVVAGAATLCFTH